MTSKDDSDLHIECTEDLRREERGRFGHFTPPVLPNGGYRVLEEGQETWDWRRGSFSVEGVNLG